MREWRLRGIWRGRGTEWPRAYRSGREVDQYGFDQRKRESADYPGVAGAELLQTFIMENYNSATPGQVPSAFTYMPTPAETDIRGMVANAAAVVSTNAGRVSATATAALAVPGPHQPSALTTAGGAAIVSLAAEAVVQALKPDPVAMFKDDFVIGIPANLLADRFPMLSPVINEVAEKIKAGAKK